MSTTRVLRTPDSFFENLEGYDFSPKYTTITDPQLGDLRVHYLDEGNPDGQEILLMHGEPSWCYLYRTMIPPLVAAGFRVFAPDLIGFGRSDKPTKQSDYSYNKHVSWMQHWFDSLQLNNVTLFCQDWGGLIGLRLVAAQPDKFAAVAAANTFLPTGSIEPSQAFLKWREFSQTVEVFPSSGIIRGATVRPMSQAAQDAYDAPYPSEEYKAGARVFPLLVPSSPDMGGCEENRKAWLKLAQFKKPFITLFSDSDPVTKGLDKEFHALIPGCKGQNHSTIERAGHFLQEDAGPEIAKHLIKLLTP